MLRFLTAGESHGKALVAILEGMVAGLAIDKKKIDQELARRKLGSGRGGRMKIEKDKVEILSGTKANLTIGSPIAILIKNKDYRIEKLSSVYCPRPGHADLAGSIKYDFKDARCVLERASARETAARTAIGALCKIFLSQFKIRIISSVVTIGGEFGSLAINKKIKQAKAKKDTLGGIFEVKVFGLPIGLGSYVHYDRRLDSRIAGAVMSIPAIKSVEFGLGLGFSVKLGSQVHDAIFYNKKKGLPAGRQGYYRKTNNAGGLEGGVTNGEALIIRACMKPISTLGNPLPSVNMSTKRPSNASIERYDTCALESAAVISEGVVAFELARAFLEKFGGDSLNQVKQSHSSYLK